MKKMASYFVILSGVLWGSMGFFVRTLNTKGLETMDIVALRAIVTVISLFFFLLFFDRRLLQIRIKDIWCFLGTGICSIVFFNYCYFKAIMMTSLSIASVLLYTAPIIVMVLSSFLFGEKLTKRKLLAIIMTFAGCLFVTGGLGESTSISPEGLLAGLGAGFGYALYSVFGRYALERGYHSLTITFYTFLTAAAGTIVLSDIRVVVKSMIDERSIFWVAVAFGVFCTVIPYFTYTLGLKYIENSKASILASVEPVTATILGALFFHETLTIEEILGAILVIGALMVCREKGDI